MNQSFDNFTTEGSFSGIERLLINAIAIYQAKSIAIVDTAWFDFPCFGMIILKKRPQK